MANLSHAQKRELQRSLDQITDLCAGGEHPDNAIIKVAKQNNLSEDMLPILARSYNIGATALQWKSKDQNEKIASFPIADIDKINAILYPKAVKSASKKGVSIVDNTFEKSASSLNVDWFHRDYDYDALPMVKSSSVYREEDKKAIVALDDAIVEKAMKLEQDASMQKVAAEDTFNQSVAELADEISYGFGLSNFKKTAKSLYGDVGVKLTNYVAERFPTLKINDPLEKQASALSKNDSLLKTAEKVLKNLSEYVAAELNYEKVLKKCASVLKPIKERRENECFGPEIDRILMTPSEVKEATWKQARVDALPSLKEYVTRTEGPAYDIATKSEREALKAMKDRTPLRNQKVKALLLDLMSSDPYLRQQDPDVIVAAFNDLYEANPTDALKRIWLKTHLPQYIASENMDSSIIANIIEAGRSAEKNERERVRSILDEFMNNVAVRKEINTNEREEEGLQVKKDELKEMLRSNKAREKATERSEKETVRANRAKERYMEESNIETARSHRATEAAEKARDAETARANKEKERLTDNSNKETNRHNTTSEKETERHNKETESETSIHNRETERLTSNSNVETARHNTATEEETARHNADSEWETSRHNLETEQETNRANTEKEKILTQSNTNSQNANTETARANQAREAAQRLELLRSAVRPDAARGFQGRGGQNSKDAWGQDLDYWKKHFTQRTTGKYNKPGGGTYSTPYDYLLAKVPGDHEIWTLGITSDSNPLAVQRLIDEYKL